MLPREQYLPAAGEDTALWCSVSYLDGQLTREEVLRESGSSDAYLEWKRRVSTDNGRTWSDCQPIEDATRQLPGGGLVTYPCGHVFDPRLGLSYERRLLRLWPGEQLYTYEWGKHQHPFNDHTFVVENGQAQKLLKYEEGPDYDPENPFAPEFCTTNRAYLGVNIAFGEDGTAYHPIVCYQRGESYSKTKGGVVLMRREPSSGEWRPSTQEYLSPERSARGLLEPDAAVLKDGRVLVVCRGSNTATTPGRKWFSISADGGRTLSRFEALRYDDGSPFYSPSSIHTFVRSSKNGRLYWLANIVDGPPSGNGPRYPLVLAEIDEEKVAVRKDRLTTVDERGMDEPVALQLSNFSVLEDRETQNIEIYLTRLGENPEHFWQGAVYRYVFST